MAKTQKYSEDLMLEAVVKFAEEVKTKIKATELAEWARNNIKGLEDVRDYHFTRSIKERDSKTGKIKEKVKLCSAKINEINKSRSITATMNNNVLLRSSKVDAVFELPLSVQRKLIVETREAFDTLLKKNGYLTTENDSLRRVNKEQATIIDEINVKIKDIRKKQRVLRKQVNYLLRITDENSRKEMLAHMGIEDGSVDINKYIKCIEEDLVEMFHIGKTLKQYHQEEKVDSSNNEDLTESVLSGLNFDE